ncbi:hypothetical protein PG987_014657 [Apiospora arundinis]
MLALTCKSAMDLYYPKTPLVWDEITHVRRLMELSVSDRLYYCWDCTYLHHLDRLDPKEWRIRAREHGYSQPSLRRPDPNNPNHTKKFVRTSLLVSIYSDDPTNNPYVPYCEYTPPDHFFGIWRLGFRHFQLIMNEHLYGPGRGIALSPGFIEATTIGDWSLKPSVAILDGQLFLSVRYAITVRGPLLQGWPHMKGFKFCHHLQDSQEFWGPQPAVHGLPGLQILREWWQSGGARMPSRTHMQGHCDLCLTDYTVRMRRNQDPVPQQPTIRDLEYDAEAHSLNPRGRRNGLRPNKTDVDVEIVTYH